MHEAFVLHTEYLNYYQAFPYAESKAGAYQYSEDYCSHNSSYPNTFCVWQNNIKAAYPEDLYSDEVAIPSSGLSFHVIPAAKEQPVGGNAWPMVNTTYLFQFPAKAPEQPGAAYPYDDIVSQYWNLPIIVPDAWLGSAVQTFTSFPKASFFSAYESEVYLLNNDGPKGPWTFPEKESSTVAEFFLYQINQSPISPWIGLGSEYLSFYTRDNISVRTNKNVTGYGLTIQYYDWYFEINASVADKSKYKIGKDCRSVYSCAAYAEDYYIGIIQKRTWWEGSVGAATFKPPCPPLPQGQQC